MNKPDATSSPSDTQAPCPASHPVGLNNPTVSRDMGWLGVATLLVSALSYGVMDYPVAVFVRSLPWSAREVANQLTEFGQMNHYAWLLPLAVVASWLLKQRAAAMWFLLALAGTLGSGLLVNMLKIVFGRARPSMLFELSEFGFGPLRLGYHHASFPSGHAATVGALVAVLWLRWPARWWAWLAIGIVIALTRVFTLSHYVSDVLVGAYLGAIFTLLVHRAMVRRSLLG